MLLGALILVGLSSVLAIAFYYATLSFDSKPDTTFLVISILVFLEFVLVASGKNENVTKFALALTSTLFLGFLFNLDISWQHRKHLYEKIQGGITDIEYCNLNYNDKLVIEALSTRGITDCRFR